MNTEMGSDSVHGEPNHVINVWEANQHRLHLMRQKIADSPKLLTKSAAKSSCCIFRVPHRFIEINGKSYRPHIVSIGPYHRGERQLQMIEEHKWRYLGCLLTRIRRDKGLDLQDLLKAIEPLESKARECYSETIRLDKDDFLEMMVLDGCFVLELFRKVANVVGFESDDPIITTAWIIPFFYRDLLRLENQIPFFVVECLFDLSRTEQELEDGSSSTKSPSLSALALIFFNGAFQRPDHVIARHSKLKARHLLDLVRSSFIQFERTQQPIVNTPTTVIHSASKLCRAGIQLHPGKDDSFLVVRFRGGVIEMPTLTVDDTTSSFLLNCVAYEQCHKNSTKHFTTYVFLLDCLVNTYKDVEYLCDNNIIENYFGTDTEVARFINNLGKEVAFDIERCYLSQLFHEIGEYYKNSWHVQWASFKYTYFNNPLTFYSALAGLVLLLLTVAQTFYTIYGTYRK